MSERVEVRVTAMDGDEAVRLAKEEIRRQGRRLRTVASVRPTADRPGWIVTLAVDDREPRP